MPTDAEMARLVRSLSPEAWGQIAGDLEAAWGQGRAMETIRRIAAALAGARNPLTGWLDRELWREAEASVRLGHDERWQIRSAEEVTMPTDAEMMEAVWLWLDGPKNREAWCTDGECVPDYLTDDAASCALLEELSRRFRYVGISRTDGPWVCLILSKNAGGTSDVSLRPEVPDRRRAILLAAYEASKE